MASSLCGSSSEQGDTDMVLWQDEPLKSSVIKKNVPFSDTTKYRTLPTKTQKKNRSTWNFSHFPQNSDKSPHDSSLLPNYFWLLEPYFSL